MVNFNLCGYIAQAIELEAYKLQDEPQTIYEGEPTPILIEQIIRYLDIIGGIEVLPEDWQANPTPVGLFHYLLAKVRKDEKAQLQKLLHHYVQKDNAQKCDRLVPQQSRAIGYIYLATHEAKADGMAALLATPTQPSRTFSSQQILVTFCKMFGFPLPGIMAGSQYCPGCKAPIDEYGVHLLNCSKISTKDTPDPFSRQMLHNTLAEKICEIASHKFYNVGTNPKGARNCPTLNDGKTKGRLDLQYDPRDSSLNRILGDVSVGNPLSSDQRGTITKRDAISDIRAQKNNKYRKPIETLPNTQLVVFAFTHYGQMSHEVLNLLHEVSEHVAEQNTLLSQGHLYNKYKKDLSCVLHKGVARVLASRIDLLRVSTNQIRRQHNDIRELITLQNNETLEDRQNVG